MPAWAAKLGLALAQALAGDDARKHILSFAAGLFLLALAAVMVLPVLVANIPLVAAEKISAFFDATRTLPEGVEVPWEEVAAAWAVLHDQDFSGAERSAIDRLAQNWLERHEEEIETTENGKTVKKVIVWYTLRSFDQVMDLLRMTPGQKDQARRYLLALKEGGLKPPPGWKASPPPGWAWPVPGYDTAASITTGYGFRIHPITGQPEMHWGLDIAAPEGTPVVAALAGTVVETGNDQAYGNYVVIAGGSFEASYGHLSAVLARRGEKVRAGDQIGRVGSTGLSTGPHLDFRLKSGGRPVNPLEYF